MYRTLLLPLAVLVMLPPSSARGQQPNPLGAAPADSAKAQPEPNTEPPAGFAGVDSVVYRLIPSSRLEVRTGKAGLFGFAGHGHSIRARTFSGDVVYYPHAADRSHLEITVQADSLEVLTPPDTAEIRKVTATMRTDVLHTDEYHEIRLATKEVAATAHGFHIIGALTLVGQTRDVPIDVGVELGADTLHAQATFAIKQTDFGIKPYSGGPGGTVKVANRVTFTIDALAVRVMPSANGGP